MFYDTTFINNNEENVSQNEINVQSSKHNKDVNNNITTSKNESEKKQTQQ